VNIAAIERLTSSAANNGNRSNRSSAHRYRRRQRRPPTVFTLGIDPVQLGLAASLARPGGNLTGIDALIAQIGAKRLEVLHDLLPKVTRISVLVNPADAGTTDAQLKDIEAAALADCKSRFTMPTLVTRLMQPSRQWVAIPPMQSLSASQHF
jgi:hypothetical protein